LTVHGQACELAPRRRGKDTGLSTGQLPKGGAARTAALSASSTQEQEKLLMKQLRIIGLALLALFALGAFTASLASAEEGVLPNANSTGTGGTATLETEKENITCTAVSIKEGKFVPLEKETAKDQHGTATLDFTGCKAEKAVGINTLGDEKEIILSKVLFLVCLVEPKTLQFGLLIQPIATEHLEIPVTKQLLLVKGAVIAAGEKVLSGTEFLFLLKGEKGKQVEALKCEINGKVFTHTFESALDSEAKDKPASETAHFTLTFAALVEFMDT
jgi:hypothetical protein